MTLEDPDTIATWLKHHQNVEIEAARLGEPAATARRLADLANAADRALAFGDEPAGFTVAQNRLLRVAGDLFCIWYFC